MKKQTINKLTLKKYKQPTFALEIISSQDIFMTSKEISGLPKNDSSNQIGWRK